MKKFSSYAFWLAFVGALVVFLEDIEALLGIDINTTLIESVILSFCGILVVLGVVTKKDQAIDTEANKDVNETNIEADNINKSTLDEDVDDKNK